MATQGLPQERTHDIDRLGRVLEEHGVDLPVPRPHLAELTDFAVPLRYEDLLDVEALGPSRNDHTARQSRKVGGLATRLKSRTAAAGHFDSVRFTYTGQRSTSAETAGEITR
jgi:hypothetical protein